jgi:hypothetical protein
METRFYLCGKATLMTLRPFSLASYVTRLVGPMPPKGEIDLDFNLVIWNRIYRQLLPSVADLECARQFEIEKQEIRRSPSKGLGSEVVAGGKENLGG